VSAWVVAALVSVALAVMTGWLVPAWAMKRLMPALESGGPKMTNYRGRNIPTGLGIVWLAWGAGVAAVEAIAYYALVNGGPRIEIITSASPVLQIVGVPVLVLTLGAVAFGMIDDLFGDSSARGFRGHLSALAHGRLTTGGLKLLGIGCLSLFAGYFAIQPAAAFRGGPMAVVSDLVSWACAALVIALSANLVNLTDLRPGRALKVYGALATIGVGLATWSVWSTDPAAGLLSSPVRLVWIGCMKLSLLALVLGPILAVWRFDLGERAMLGDAGANAMGALAGFLLAWHSPLWLLAVLALVLLALNLVSERVSFSKVIERTTFLRWLDGLGRLPSDAPG
jgi:hypothetical protein